MLSSRSQPDPKALETIERMREIGADVVMECGDIAAAGTAQRLEHSDRHRASGAWRR